MKKIKLKIMFSVIFLLTLVFFNSKTFAFDATNFNPEYGITTSNLNLRKAANLDSSSRVSTIPQNTNLQILGSISDFYIVQLQNNSIGLLSKEYINITEKNGDYANYQMVEKYYVTVNSDSTNLRGGPGTYFQIYAKLSKDQRIEVLGKINDFLLVVTENNTVGMVREDLVTKEFNIQNLQIKEKIQEMFNLINNKREQNGISKLEILPKLEEVANIKAEDMVKNNYFAHESPQYSNPFDMMKNFGITYKTAGENIAGNSSVEKAFNAWMNSDSHKQNILSSAYNYVGIGIYPSEKYGYVIVVMFIRKIAKEFSFAIFT